MAIWKVKNQIAKMNMNINHSVAQQMVQIDFHSKAYTLLESFFQRLQIWPSNFWIKCKLKKL
jgi:hypothetical protein